MFKKIISMLAAIFHVMSPLFLLISLVTFVPFLIFGYNFVLGGSYPWPGIGLVFYHCAIIFCSYRYIKKSKYGYGLLLSCLGYYLCYEIHGSLWREVNHNLCLQMIHDPKCRIEKGLFHCSGNLKLSASTSVCK